jgi:hypothetical protein
MVKSYLEYVHGRSVVAETDNAEATRVADDNETDRQL